MKASTFLKLLICILHFLLKILFSRQLDAAKWHIIIVDDEFPELCFELK